VGHQIKFEKGGSVETTTFEKVETHQINFEQGVRIKKMSALKVCFLNIAVISFGGVWQILPRTYSFQCNAFTKPNI
jgi:hypothetical protein